MDLIENHSSFKTGYCIESEEEECVLPSARETQMISLPEPGFRTANTQQNNMYSRVTDSRVRRCTGVDLGSQIVFSLVPHIPQGAVGALIKINTFYAASGTFAMRHLPESVIF